MKQQALRTVSLPVKSDGSKSQSSLRRGFAAFAGNPGIVDSDGEDSPATVHYRAFSLSSPGKKGISPPIMVQSIGQVSPSPDVEGDSTLQSMQDQMHTPIASVTDSSGRSFSVDRLLEALILDAPTPESPSSKKGRADLKQEKNALFKSLSPVQPRIPIFLKASIDFLKQNGMKLDSEINSLRGCNLCWCLSLRVCSIVLVKPTLLLRLCDAAVWTLIVLLDLPCLT